MFDLNIYLKLRLVWFGLWCLTPLATIFEIYRLVLLVEETGIPG